MPEQFSVTSFALLDKHLYFHIYFT